THSRQIVSKLSTMIIQGIYLVIVISQTVSGNAETLCAHLLPKEPVTFTVTLVGEPVGNRTLLRETVTRDFHRCVAFQVPAVSAATTAAIHASVQGASETLQKITEFIINPSSNVVDPNRNRIAQWLNQSSVSGILDFSYPIATEAMQGVYVITAWDERGRKTSHKFQVKEYGQFMSVNILTPDKKCYEKTFVPFTAFFISLYFFEPQTLCLFVTVFSYQVKVAGSNSAALENKPVSLLVKHGYSSDKWTLTTDSKGIAQLLVDTSSWMDEIVRLEVKYIISVYGAASVLVVRSVVLQLNFTHAMVPFTNSITPNYYNCHGKLLCFFFVYLPNYLLIVTMLNVLLSVVLVNKGEFTVHVRQTRDLAPYAQVVVYTVLPSGEIVADSSTVPIQKCLKNKVSLKFSSLQELPGKKTTLDLTADPGSLCSLRAVDQSVLLMEPQVELTVDSVSSNPIQSLDKNGVIFSYFANSPWNNPKCCHEISLPGHIQIFGFFLQEIGVKILTNSDVREPKMCFSQYSKAHTYNCFLCTGCTVLCSSLPPHSDSGSVKVEHTVPDTITKWVAGAFCSSPTGFGLAPNTDLTAFQPFFVSLTLPYSVIRGEAFTLKATVFNYLSKCIMVQVNLNESAQYAAQPCEGCKYTHCLCGEESKTFKWILKPADLGVLIVNVRAEALRTEELCGSEVVTVPERGRIDTVVRTLLVEVSLMIGLLTYLTSSELLDHLGVEKNVPLKLPEVFVQGSHKAFLSVMGDLMGRAMKNLGSLLAMPYGCGEQNMVLFAPNIYILRYLETTRQLTEEIKAKATRFLENGYQRELNYKHHDGSYSAFGKADGSGNTWLTAFVLKSFGGAKPYIFVDPRHITDAINWLSRHQQPSGCFMAVGKLFNNKMKGGVSDEVSLTAYITAGLLELNRNSTVRTSLSCLKNASGQLENLYTTALLSYTFTLAGDQEMRSKLIAHLASKAKISGGSWQWQHLDTSSKKTDSLEVEMASYMLLALLSGPQLPGFGLGYASVLVRWLVQQQNPYGGFSSTQDTVVALQALSLYSSATFSPEGDTTVTVTSGGGYKQEFKLNQHNRFLYQEEELEVPGDYSIKAEGKGCALVQITVHYNIPPPADFSAFSITATAEGPCNRARKTLNVTIEVWYNGRREETNMVIVSIKLLSGYLPDKASLQTVREPCM
uniref:Alpha-2-macroglobulin-like n=1 Tax=Scleropages formosus TaxID=113540 RepID=A0A8C9QWU6_SCLFO